MPDDRDDEIQGLGLAPGEAADVIATTKRLGVMARESARELPFATEPAGFLRLFGELAGEPNGDAR